MADIARMRTVRQVIEYFKQQDPDSCIGEYYLRCLIKQNKIPIFRTGRKQLINLDKLIDYLNGESTVNEPVLQGCGKIRRVLE